MQYNYPHFDVAHDGAADLQGYMNAHARRVVDQAHATHTPLVFLPKVLDALTHETNAARIVLSHILDTGRPYAHADELFEVV